MSDELKGTTAFSFITHHSAFIISRYCVAGFLYLSMSCCSPWVEPLWRYLLRVLMFCLRSGERRVGEECRSRWGADHLKKKKEKGGWAVGDVRRKVWRGWMRRGWIAALCVGVARKFGGRMTSE